MQVKKVCTIAALFFVACAQNENKPLVEPEKMAPLAQQVNSIDFNATFGSFLQAYYDLKNAFFKSDDAQVTRFSEVLAARVDSLNIGAIRADTSILMMARQYKEGIAAEAHALKEESAKEERLKSFQMISDNLYDLLRTVRYNKAIIYHQYCPMAFNKSGAYWLSADAKIENPYFSKQMPGCGEVKDSIDFRAK